MNYEYIKRETDWLKDDKGRIVHDELADGQWIRNKKNRKGWEESPVPSGTSSSEEVDDRCFEVVVSDIFLKSELLLLQKHKDYGPTNISKSPGGPLNGLRVRMWDKIARINHLIDSGATPENESLEDSFRDLMNYSAIALMVLEGKWPNE